MGRNGTGSSVGETVRRCSHRGGHVNDGGQGVHILGQEAGFHENTDAGMKLTHDFGRKEDKSNHDEEWYHCMEKFT